MMGYNLGGVYSSDTKKYNTGGKGGELGGGLTIVHT